MQRWKKKISPSLWLLLLRVGGVYSCHLLLSSCVMDLCEGLSRFLRGCDDSSVNVDLPIRRRNLLIHWPDLTNNVSESWRRRDASVVTRQSAWKLVAMSTGREGFFILQFTPVITVTHIQQDSTVVLQIISYLRLTDPVQTHLPMTELERQKQMSHLLEFLPVGKTPPSGLWSSESVAPRALTDG